MIYLSAGCVAALFAAGLYLMLSRNLQRVALGFLLLSNGVNLMVITCVRLPDRASAPVVGSGPGLAADPLPQAFLLTAIVIGLGAAAFLLALTLRLRQQSGSDTLEEG